MKACPECRLFLLEGEKCPICNEDSPDDQNHPGIGEILHTSGDEFYPTPGGGGMRVPTVDDKLYASTYRMIGGADYDLE